jgi:hypothetical protein
MPCRLDGTVINKYRNTRRVRLSTVHDHPHVLDETVDDILREPVEALQDRLNILISFLYKFDCIALSKGNAGVRADSLDRSCLSCLVAKPSVERSSTMILNITSSSAGVGGIRVYILRRSRVCSMDSSKSTSASWSESTPLAA